MLATSAELGDKRPGDGCEHHIVDGAACAMSGSDDVGQGHGHGGEPSALRGGSVQRRPFDQAGSPRAQPEFA